MTTSRFRKEYRPLSGVEQAQVQHYKDLAEQMEVALVLCPDARYKALALTALEESVMWATKGITG